MVMKSKSLTEKEIDIVVRVYLEEKTVAATARRLKLGYKLVKTVLIKRSVIIKKPKSNRHRSDMKQYEIDKIVRDYRDHAFSFTSLAKKNNTSVDVVRAIIESEVTRKKVRVFNDVGSLLSHCYKESSNTHKNMLNLFPVVA